jgi:hypothetical protein
VEGTSQYGVYRWQGTRWRAVGLTTATQMTVVTPKGACIRYTVASRYEGGAEFMNLTGIVACR